ncbi:MAG TPA: ferritin-like domain-containing protein [Acidimicrobiales bacterium]|nr:ferritin-like domain-containing protein [Acidimicrobiales bacterium]
MRKTNEWQARISHTFTAHAVDERYVLDRYQELLDAATDPGVRFLLGLILDDEHRHHRFFEQLRHSAAVDAGSDGVVPLPPRPDPGQVPALLEQTRRFREIEQDDAASLRELEHDLRSADDERLWHLLVVLMQLDTEKHLHILGYLERHLEDLEKAGG